jgi:ABC-2 type transport system permease protein
MNLQSNALGESPLESVVSVPAVIPASQRFYWSVRRELWENRSIYLAPLAVAALFLLGFLISTGSLPNQMRAASVLNPIQQQELFGQPYTFAALLLMGTTFLVAVFYCLDALHSERRDRSILFWKSLPVSDLTTVLAKASIPLLILPLLTVAITVVTHCIMLLLSGLVMMAYGLQVAMLWSHVPVFQMWPMVLFHMVAMHGLWYAPIYGWLLLVSGWARRAALLWAVLPPLAIGVTEKIAFNTSHFAALLGHRFGGGDDPTPFTAGQMVMAPLTLAGLGRFLISPGLWTGLLAAAVFLAAAVRLRRYRDPM